MKLKTNTIYFAKVKNDGIIPNKRNEDAGYDIYPNFLEESIIINPNEVKLISTGIATAFAKGNVLLIKERSSTGAKGMAIRMGVIDSGFRGEIVIGINNTNNIPILITKDKNYKNDNYIIHPYDKAIAQGILFTIPKMKKTVVKYNKLLKISSKRKKTYLGSSGK